MSTNLNNQTNELSPQVDATYIADGSVSNAEFQALDGVTGSIQTTTLANGKIWIGNASNVSNAVTPSGDFTITNTGVGAISSDVIVNSDIKTDAAIALTKLAATTASRALVSDASGVITPATTTASEIGFVNGVTSSIQTQLDAKASSASLTAHTGASSGVHGVTGSVVGTSDAQTLTNKVIDADSNTISNIENADIKAAAAIALNKLAATTVSRALVSDGSGFVSAATTTSTEIGYVNGVTSAIQTQINNKQATITGAATTITSSDLTVSRALVSDGSGKIAAATTTSTEIGYVNGVTSAIQTQLDAKQLRSVITAKGSLYVGTASNTVAEQTVGTNGYVLTADSGVTNGISYQLPVNQSTWLNNIGLATSVGSNALTIALKTSAGNDPSSTAPVFVAFRNATLTTGQFSIVSITGALSLVISSGSTLGQRSAIASRIYIYLINNAGTAELAASRSLIPEETGVVSTTAEGGAGAADSANVMYSTTARSNVAFRLIGTLDNTQATAGTWASAGTTLSVTTYADLDISGIMYKTSSQNPGTTAATKITWDSVSSSEGAFDPWSICDLTNERLVASRAGRWFVFWSLSASNFDASATIQETIYKNGSGTIRNDYNSGTQGNTRDLKGFVIMDLAINDYLEIFTSSSADSSYSINGVAGLNDSTSYFGMFLVK